MLLHERTVDHRLTQEMIVDATDRISWRPGGDIKFGGVPIPDIKRRVLVPSMGDGR